MAYQLAINSPQFLFDDTLIDQQQGIMRHWLPASVYPDPVLWPDRSWEGRSLLLYGTVLSDPENGYRMYYCAFRPDAEHSIQMLATSQDGFTWEKPDLGLVEYKGSRANNIVFPTESPMDSPSIIFDGDDEQFPYKLLCCHYRPQPAQPDGGYGMYAYHSADGLHWEPIPGRRIRMGDRNSLFKDSRSERFVLFTRDPEVLKQTGRRNLSRSESADFLNWSEPELVLINDPETEPDVEYYGMPVFERHGWYFGLIEYWNHVRDVIEVHLVVSRDTRTWSRPLPDQPFIAATYPWNRAWNTCANNGPVIMNEQMVFYFGGRWVGHDWDTARHHGVVGFASLPLDRFCAIEGDGNGGRFTTVPIEWPGGALVLNADTRQSYESHPLHTNGEIAVEVLDATGTPLPEWSGERKAIYRGNTHCRGTIYDGEVRWPDERSLDALCGQHIRLRFHLKNARLFTIEARE